MVHIASSSVVLKGGILLFSSSLADLLLSSKLVLTGAFRTESVPAAVQGLAAAAAGAGELG